MQQPLLPDVYSLEPRKKVLKSQAKIFIPRLTHFIYKQISNFSLMTTINIKQFNLYNMQVKGLV